MLKYYSAWKVVRFCDKKAPFSFFQKASKTEVSDIFKAVQLFLLVFGAFFAWLFYRQRKVRILSKFIPIKAGLFLFDDKKSGTGTVDDMAYQYDFFAGGGSPHHRHPSHFTLSIACPVYGHFVIHKPSFFHWLMVKMHLYSSLQTGDPVFDKKFLVQTLTHDFAFTLFNNPEITHHIESLFQIGFNYFELDGERLEARWSPFLPFFRKKPLPNFVEEVVRNLIQLSKKVQAVHQPAGVTKEEGTNLAARHRALNMGVTFLILMIVLLVLIYLKIF